MPDENTNLPILDDIIKPGDADKAVNPPSSKVQDSLLPDAETSLHTADNGRRDSDQPDTADQSDLDATDRMRATPASVPADELTIDEAVPQRIQAEMDLARPTATDVADVDALTNEILDNLILQIEPLLRNRIQQTLSKYFAGKTRTD